MNNIGLWASCLPQGSSVHCGSQRGRSFSNHMRHAESRHSHHSHNYGGSNHFSGSNGASNGSRSCFSNDFQSFRQNSYGSNSGSSFQGGSSNVFTIVNLLSQLINDLSQFSGSNYGSSSKDSSCGESSNNSSSGNDWISNLFNNFGGIPIIFVGGGDNSSSNQGSGNAHGTGGAHDSNDGDKNCRPSHNSNGSNGSHGASDSKGHQGQRQTSGSSHNSHGSSGSSNASGSHGNSKACGSSNNNHGSSGSHGSSGNHGSSSNHGSTGSHNNGGSHESHGADKNCGKPKPAPNAINNKGIQGNHGGGDGCGRVWGDPHFVGANNQNYDVMGTPGHFYNLLSTNDMRVNADFKSWGNAGANAIKDIGIQDSKGNRIEIGTTGSLKINGADQTKDGSYLNGEVVKCKDTVTVQTKNTTAKVTADPNNYLNVDFTEKGTTFSGGLWGQSMAKDKNVAMDTKASDFEMTSMFGKPVEQKKADKPASC